MLIGVVPVVSSVSVDLFHRYGFFGISSPVQTGATNAGETGISTRVEPCQFTVSDTGALAPSLVLDTVADVNLHPVIRSVHLALPFTTIQRSIW